jgi:hypothetical protein
MQDLLTWGALIAASGSIIAIITFWMNRGKAEAEASTKADAAAARATAALAKAELVSAQLAEARIEFARDYASHKDLGAAEMRYAAALALTRELRYAGLYSIEAGGASGADPYQNVQTIYDVLLPNI